MKLSENCVFGLIALNVVSMVTRINALQPNTIVPDRKEIYIFIIWFQFSVSDILIYSKKARMKMVLGSVIHAKR